MKALLSFSPLLAQVSRPMAAALALSLVTLAAGVALLGISGWFLTAAALTTVGATFNLFGPSAGVRGLAFVRVLSRYGEKLTGHDATLKLLSDLRQWLFGHLFPLVPLGRRLGRADLISRLIADVDALDTMFLLALGPISTALLTGIAMTAGLAVLLPGAAWWYGSTCLMAVLGVPALLVLSTRRVGGQVLEAQAELRRIVLDGVDGHQDLVVFGATAATMLDADKAAQRLASARRRLGAHGALASGATQMLVSAAVLGTLLPGLAAVRAGTIDGPLFVGVLLAVVASFEATAMMVRSATRLAGAAAAAERLQEIAGDEPAVREPITAINPGPGTDLTFENVTFGYSAARPVLRHIDLHVHSGECIAVIGPSGSGKSTIAHLIFRLADPQHGAVRLNGVDLWKIASSDLHRRAALMPQDAPVFLDTVRNNLLIGRPDATDAELMDILAAVGLAPFVIALPTGLDTLLGEAGRTLSAGQARRLCLARTLLSPAQLLVLDEPTSGLDAEAEAAFLSSLPALLKGRTAIVITHAEVPSGIFDRVIPLRAGTV